MKKNKSFNSLREHEKEARRDIIISAAERVFSRKPFNAVTIRDVAKEAGISHALIYRYFPDQQALFVEACFRHGIKILNFIRGLIDENNDITIETVTDQFINYLIDNDQYFRMMTHFMLDGSLSGEMIERLNSGERVLLDQFDRLFMKMNTGKNVRMLSHAYFAAMNGVVITFRNYPGRSRDEVVNHMRQIGRIIASKFKE
jgi:AcrR family transcriptional regulator